MKRLLSMFVLLPALSIAAQVPETRETDLCSSPRTLDIVACMNHQLEAAEASLVLYLTEVRRMHGADQEDMAALEAAQAAWSAFVEADCGAVHMHFRDGTIRGPMAVGCKLSHTEARICQLWATYLDHMVTELTEPTDCK